MRRLLAIAVVLSANLAGAEPDKPKLLLELGDRSVRDVDKLIHAARDKNAGADAGGRVAALMELFRGTPFEYESRAPIPPKGTLRVRTDRLDCTTSVITALAAGTARDFDEFTENLRRIRYWNSDAGIDSDPFTGNILDFAWELFVDNAVAQGFADDVTKEVAGDAAAMTAFSAKFTRRQRGINFDPDQRTVVARVHDGATVTAQMISDETFARMNRSRIRTGDLLLFTHVDPKRPVGDELLVGHVAVAVNVDGEIYMLHATPDFMWRADGSAKQAPRATGVYYNGDFRREQLGVTMATTFVDNVQVRVGNATRHGYDPVKLRPVHDYMMGAHFHGVMVLRPHDRPRGTMQPCPAGSCSR